MSGSLERDEPDIKSTTNAFLQITASTLDFAIACPPLTYHLSSTARAHAIVQTYTRPLPPRWGTFNYIARLLLAIMLCHHVMHKFYYDHRISIQLSPEIPHTIVFMLIVGTYLKSYSKLACSSFIIFITTKPTGA